MLSTGKAALDVIGNVDYHSRPVIISHLTQGDGNSKVASLVMCMIEDICYLILNNAQPVMSLLVIPKLAFLHICSTSVETLSALPWTPTALICPTNSPFVSWCLSALLQFAFPAFFGRRVVWLWPIGPAPHFSLLTSHLCPPPLAPRSSLLASDWPAAPPAPVGPSKRHDPHLPSRQASFSSARPCAWRAQQGSLLLDQLLAPFAISLSPARALLRMVTINLLGVNGLLPGAPRTLRSPSFARSEWVRVALHSTVLGAQMHPFLASAIDSRALP